MHYPHLKPLLGILVTLTLISRAQAGNTQELQPVVGEPRLGLTANELDRFYKGKQAFEHHYTVEEGLGPIFNFTSSCGGCHFAGAIGGAQAGLSFSVTRFGRVDEAGSFDPLADLGGSLLQTNAIAFECRETVPTEANVTALRQATPIFGDGLIESIPESAIFAREANQPSGITGRAHLVSALEDPPGSPPRIGRFGWKADVATLRTFSAGPLLNELGITNALIPNENAPNGDANKLALCDSVADPEDKPDNEGVTAVERIEDFQKFLAPPPQTPKSGMTGERIFKNIGCAGCHLPSYPTDIPGVRAKLYSDLLLHDMGDAGDGIAQGDAGRTEIKTTPLWGLRNRFFFWHNATAPSVRSAILQHEAPGSEASPSIVRFRALSSSDQDLLIDFLGSLGRQEFDNDQGQRVDIFDFRIFRDCYNNTAPHSAPYTADEICARSDVNQDMNVDDYDFSLFARVFQGPTEDSNCNDISDLEESLSPTADANGDAIPDDARQLLNVMPYTDFIRGQSAIVKVYDATPGRLVTLMYSIIGEGAGPTPPRLGVCLNILEPKRLKQRARADSRGVATFTFNVPPTTPARVWFQAFIPASDTLPSAKSDVDMVEVE